MFGSLTPPTEPPAFSVMLAALIAASAAPWMIEEFCPEAPMETLPLELLTAPVSTTLPPEATLIVPVSEPMKLTAIG